MSDIYEKIPLDQIPWNIETPPDGLVKLLDSGKIGPCKTIDLGCGTGNYAIYLAGRGFEVTGIDISTTAIKIARGNAAKRKLKCKFLVADVLADLCKLEETFDFAYDWGLLHHIFPEHRAKYVEGVHRILNAKAGYLSVCFSEKDSGFGGPGKYRKTPLGSILYFSSEAELRELFRPYFSITDLRTLEFAGKVDSHVFNYALMEKIDSRPG